ncbi:MAG TPA: class I SAM-dependent methyltransferase [Acidobacteriota bacterium]|nr:class I SAM-dependent methyltransferase [Acidobacteriota bacterium]
MRERIKHFLKRAGIYEDVSCCYHMLKQVTPHYLLKEVKYRLGRAPDGNRVPSPRLIFRIIARGWAEQYYAMGREAAAEIIGHLESSGIDIGAMDDILDFGCGCGRIIRHIRLRTRARLYGSDYNYDLVRWCRDNLDFGKFDQNCLAPPLSYEDEKFDFIYLISVFTHLGAELQQRWMIELRRVLRPGGVMLFTTHGEPYKEFLTREQFERLLAGEVVVVDEDEEGKNHYGSFQTVENVESRLLDGFELIKYIKGRERLVQDTYLVRKKT